MINQPFPDKVSIHQECLRIVSTRIGELDAQLGNLTQSAANETKSTAGDKYETARAMLHIEQDQVRRQLADIREQQATLEAIDATRGYPRISAGSLVRFNGVWYYLSTSLGKRTIDGMTIITLSLQSPLGMALKGHSNGDQVSWNGKTFTIEDVL